MEDHPSDISVQCTCMMDDPAIDVDCLCKLARRICQQFQAYQAEVSLVVVDDEGIRQVHERFLHSEAVTDVISFDLTDADGIPSFEIVVNAQEAARQANTRGHQTAAELALYVTHGLLHQLGFDDTDEPTAQKMHQMEDKILLQAGFGTVYNTTPQDQDE
ncbi:MAG: rRNA maturation RNase YbeY [Sedimentisphaerales bacterium]|nr:rRNA maturation RNase YbeY [Sedimentisphaerales bacterium]